MATSLVHRVSFPTVKNPSKAKVDCILQIEFSIHHLKGPERNLIEIWGFNNLIPEDSDNPYVWHTMPSAYMIYLNQAFFRLKNLKYAVDHAKGDQKVMLLLKHHLLHLNMTLGKVWEEARSANINDEMNANWQSKTLDQWLMIDFHIQCHNMYDINAFIEEEAGSIEKLKMDPFDLGVLSIIFYCC